MKKKLKKISLDDLKVILENHQHWLREDCDGWKNMKADFRRADLHCANLTKLNLAGVDFSYADLRGTQLEYANLECANLEYADLRGADLSDANLGSANLHNADLSDALMRNINLREANLRFAVLDNANAHNANLKSADLRNASLSHAYLDYADLKEANLTRAAMNNADLRHAHMQYAVLRSAYLGHAYTEGTHGLPMACPSDGAFIGWKRARSEDGRLAFVKLEIPEDARRVSGTGRECRCDKAKVLKVFDEFGEEIDKAHSIYDPDFVYEVGATVTPDGFIEDRWEWGSGIYFFITRKEAEDYRW